MPSNSLSQVIKRIKASDKLLITPKMDKWLLDHPEGVMATTPEQQELLLRLTGDISNSQRTARFGASSRGTCLRQQVFRFLGMNSLRNMDSVLQNIFNDGTWRHIRHQMMGMQGGWLTDVEVKYSLPQWRLTTSLDGINTDEGWGYELKGMRNYSKVVSDGIPYGHNLQVHTTMLASDLDRWVYLVEDKGSQDWQEIVIRRDSKIIQEVKDELNKITDSVEDKQLPEMIPECKIKKGNEYKQCPFKMVCPVIKKWPKSTQIESGQM